MTSTALLCLVAIARHHGIDLSPDSLAHENALGEEELSASRLAQLAGSAGLRARKARLAWGDLIDAGQAYPFLLRLTSGRWLIVSGYRPAERGDGDLVVLDPAAPQQSFQFIPQADLTAQWAGEALLVKRVYRLDETERPFGLSWFIPELWRLRHLLGDIALTAAMLSLLGLAVPLFFQIIIDKVLVHQGYATLYVLTAGVVLAVVFEAVFTFLRRYLILHVSNKIDIRVATRTFAHLMRLPIQFFDRISTGTLVKHMQQAEKIREFLTGRLFLTLIDCLSLLVFIPLLMMYNVTLTCVVLGFSALVAAVIASLIQPFRRRLKDLYEVEGLRQSLLVEGIHGMRTIKSLALEPQQRKVWEGWSAQALTLRYRVGHISAIAQTAGGSLEKLMLITLVGWGTIMVFDGSLTVGALVAFQMLAGRVSGPLNQIVGLVHEYQETALSVRMLGSVMNTAPERAGASRGIQPPITGSIEFDRVTFRYDPQSEPALNNASIAIPAGTMIGVVGRSGSGKTTLTRLLHGFYQPQAGVIRLDGRDLREIDLPYLRSRIGMVLQENFLFRGTIRENIAAPRPGASFEEVMTAAELAGATEFIERLPRGFDTLLEENASNLSGGQRQRLAIARALITYPPVLVLDEATSALDPDSEAIIQGNLRKIAAGRTLLIVSHRLSTLVDADAIIVLDRGAKIAMGRHAELLEQCPIYANLWRQQMRQMA